MIEVYQVKLAFFVYSFLNKNSPNIYQSIHTPIYVRESNIYNPRKPI